MNGNGRSVKVVNERLSREYRAIIPMGLGERTLRAIRSTAAAAEAYGRRLLERIGKGRRG